MTDIDSDTNEQWRGPRRQATCECCRRNDAPEGAKVCTSCGARVEHLETALRLIGGMREPESAIARAALDGGTATPETEEQRRARVRDEIIAETPNLGGVPGEVAPGGMPA